ncbi:MAG: hypothetical protein H0W24_00485, partial [Lysobacter sp.]|nr:hypothetical protein [Lysobacter sp.]
MVALSAAQAQELPSVTGEQHDHEPVDLTRIEVRASPLPGTAEDLARPVEVLTGARLDEAKANSLGET